MFKIGLVNVSTVENEGKGITEDVKKNVCEFTVIQNENLLQELSSVDGVIIQNLSDKDMTAVFEMIIKIRKNTTVPIWAHINENKAVNRMVNLQLGVLGNMGEEVSIEEIEYMIANALTLLRMSNKVLEESYVEKNYMSTIELNELHISAVFEGNIEIGLTKLEYKLLYLLRREPNTVIKYDAIFKYIWGEETGQDKIYRVANIAFHLRNKLKKHAIDPNIIKTVRTNGYLLKLN